MISRPMRLWKVGLATAMGCSYAVVMVVPPLRDFFELTSPPATIWLQMAVVVAVAGALVVSIPALTSRLLDEPRR
jgi:hypothetical protein